MSFIQWTNQLSVNVAEIDREHRHLVETLNKLFDAMQSGKSADVLHPILAELVKYTKIHFQTEEKYFAQFNYPDAEAHIKEHREFIATVSAFIKDYKSGKVGLSADILRFLKTWLSSHIMGTDKAYSTFLNQNGLS